MTEERKVDNLGVDSSLSNLYTGLPTKNETQRRFYRIYAVIVS